MTLAAVAIGRNEGERLIACLTSMAGDIPHIVYVDSGSTDGSREAARELGADVVELDMSVPFTAARARNAGFDRVRQIAPDTRFVQFVDGDCVLQPGWVAAGCAFFDTHPEVAALCGRLRERFPERSVYNRLADYEWDTPVGPAKATGGNVMIRARALEQVDGFDPDLIAGEEPELCVRLRAAGWKIWRLEAEMALHDVAMTRFSQWWQRARRGGFACAQGVALHGAPPERHCVPQFRRILLWGMALPLVTLIGALVSPWCLLLLLIWPLQALRLWRREGQWEVALFMTLSKLPEAQGVLTYLWRRLRRTGPRLIEYK